MGVQLAAAIIVFGLIGITFLIVRRTSDGSGRGGLFHGYDYRISTSKTVAALWTISLAFMLVAETLIGVSSADFGAYMKRVLDDVENRNLYIILLGGPYAAAIIAKTVVTTRVNNGTLQKTDGTTKHLKDVVSNDAGEIDLYDLQYVLFNLIVLLAALSTFWRRPEAGLPDLPNFMAFLTGGAALTYSVNKGVTSNQPVLTAVHPQSARIGDQVTAFGNNLTAVSAATGLKAAVAGVAATVVTSDGGAGSMAGGQDKVTFLAPAPAGATTWSPTEQQQVTVTTPSGLIATLNNALMIVPDRPVAVRLSPSLLAVASSAEYADIPIHIQGQFLAAPGATSADKATATVSVTDLKAGRSMAATAAYVDDSQVSFIVPVDARTPRPGEILTFRVTLQRGTGAPTAPLDLAVQSIAEPVLDGLTPKTIWGDPGTDLSGQRVVLKGTRLTPPSPSGVLDVATAGAEPLKVVVTNPAGNKSTDPVEGASDTSATITLYGPLVIPDEREAAITVALMRGTLQSKDMQLTLRPRFDADLNVTGIPPKNPGETLADSKVTVTSEVLTPTTTTVVPEDVLFIPRDHSIGLTARIDTGGGAHFTGTLSELDGPPGRMLLTLGDGAPPMPTDQPPVINWTLKILAKDVVIARGNLHLSA